MTRARIYRPSKTAMQSGMRNTRRWVLEFERESKSAPDPLMGWAGSDDTRTQIRLRFPTREEAEDYAKRYRLDYVVLPEHRFTAKPKPYARNFR